MNKLLSSNINDRSIRLKTFYWQESYRFAFNDKDHFYLSLYISSFLLQCIHWPLWCTRCWWTNINIISDYYYDYLSLTRKRRRPKRTTMFNTDCVRTIWSTTIGCRKKSITYTFTRMSVRCLLESIFFLFDINSHHFSLLSFGTITRHRGLSFSSLLFSSSIYMGSIDHVRDLSFSFSIIYLSKTKKKNFCLDGYWTLNEI